MVSQHALQVSRPTPKGEVEGDLARGVSRPKPAPGRCLLHGVPALGGPAVGDACYRGVCLLKGGGACSRGVCGDPLMTATAVGGTHPTGMHPCSLCGLYCRLVGSWHSTEIPSNYC